MKRWLKYAKPYLPYFIIGPICMIIEVIGEVIMPKVLGGLIDYLTITTTEEAVELPAWVAKLSQMIGKDAPFVIVVTVGMIITALLMMLGGVGGAYFASKASVNYAADLRADIYKSVQKFSFKNIDRFTTGSLITRLTNDVTNIQNMVNMLLRMALRSPGMLIGALIMAVATNPGMLIGALIMAVATNPKLSVVLAVTLPLLAVSLTAIILNGFPRFSRVQKRIDALNSDVQENITNVRVVKSFVREEYEKEKFSEANANLKKAGLDAMLLMILMNPVMTFFMNVTVLAILWFGGNMVIETSMTTG